MKPNGRITTIWNRSWEHTKWNAPMDVEMGPDGKIYVLEYGNGWYSRNADAGLSRIDYNGGNRPPVMNTASRWTGNPATCR